VTYERDRHRRKRERDQWKAVETELDGILRCAELAAAVLLQKGNPRHLTVRLQPSRRAVKRSHQERGREGEVTRVAWLDLARSTVRAIDLSHNGIRDEDTVLLAGALRINHTLTALNLSRNCIGGGGEGLAPVALAEAVGTMRALVRLDLSQNRIATKEAGHALGRALSHHGTLKELDLSNNANNATRDGGAAGFAQGIADGMKTNTALTSLHLGGNRISSAAMNGLVAIVVDTKPAMQVLCAVPFRATTLAKLDVSGQRLGAEGALVVARSLANKTNRALLSLNISNNRMATKETGSALAKALSANSVLTELDVSSNNWRKGRSYDVKKWKGDGPGFAKELANGIRTNRALTSLNLSNNNIGGAYDVHPEGWTYDDDGSGLSWKNPQGDWQEEPPPGAKQSGVVALAEALRTNEALVSVRLLSNRIGTEQANELIQMMESKENLTTLCGFSGDETELDLSGQGLSPGCGVLVANEIKHNGALTSLNVGNNHLTNDGCDMTGIKAVAAAISECK
jgi:Ran GTPase-activating protein (RanGAP) involved in mRNA processing and transport